MNRDPWPFEVQAPVLRVHGLTKTFILHLRGGVRLPVLHGVALDVQRVHLAQAAEEALG